MKLLLADDHSLFRDALVYYIKHSNPDAEVFLAKNFYEAEELLRKGVRPDLTLLDLRMPGMNSLGGFEKIRKKYPELKLALMSGVAEEKDVKQAMVLGAVGYFPKTLSGRSLLTAIEKVLAGERYLPLDRTKNRVLPSYYEDVDMSQLDQLEENNWNALDNDILDKSSGSQLKNILTPREREVTAYLIKGSTNKEIARTMKLQVVTVKLHVRSICKKLNAKNRTQAAMYAHEKNLLEERSHS